MAAEGWKQLLPGKPLYRGAGRYPIDAYSEFMPPPRLGWTPYCPEPPDPRLFSPHDPWGWYVTEFEEANELRPGLEQIARQIVGRLWHLIHGDTAHGLSRRFLDDNVYWSKELDTKRDTLKHERCVVLAPLALSRTQDDKGRIHWTLFGNSEQGPGKAFWKSFYAAPQTPGPEEDATKFIAALLHKVYGEAVESPTDLHRAGFRILPDDKPPLNFWKEELPPWTTAFLLKDRAPLTGVKYLLTFRPFTRLPDAVRKAYLKGALHLLPCPASLVFWGSPRFHRLHEELPLGLQAPLLQPIVRHRAPGGLRVPQAGLLHEANAAHGAKVAHPELVKNTYQRTHRWDRVHRDADELALLQHEDKLLHVLFSVEQTDMGLYDKPMARNIQLWTPAGELLLDGPSATPEEIKHAKRTVCAGGVFGYRFLFPAMRVGKHEVYWHRPLAAYHCPKTEQPVMLDSAPLGYLTAYPTGKEHKDSGANELAFRRAFRVSGAGTGKARGVVAAAASSAAAARNDTALSSGGHVFDQGPQHPQAVRLVSPARRPAVAAPFRPATHHGRPRRNARSVAGLASHTSGRDAVVNALLEPEETPLPRRRGAATPDSLTYNRTARRSFEETYWKTIAALAEGEFLNKNNADCVLDAATQRMLPYHDRHLDALGDYLLDYYQKQIAAAR